MDSIAATVEAHRTEWLDQPPGTPWGMAGGPLAAILNLLPDPVLALDAQRRILFANSMAWRVLACRAGLGFQRGALTFFNREADERLRQYVSREGSVLASRAACRGFRAPRDSASREWVVTISRLPMGAAEDGRSGVFLVHLVSRVPPRPVSDAVLQDLFGLSPSEVRIVRRLSRHESTPQIAKQLCRSHETVKAGLKRIFRKCDVASRSDLIALLQRISLLGRVGGSLRAVK